MSPPFTIPIVPSSIGGIVTAAKIVHSIYKTLSDSMGAAYDYQCLIAELRSFEQALKNVDLAITVALPTGRVAFAFNSVPSILESDHGSSESI